MRTRRGRPGGGPRRTRSEGLAEDEKGGTRSHSKTEQDGYVEVVHTRMHQVKPTPTDPLTSSSCLAGLRGFVRGFGQNWNLVPVRPHLPRTWNILFDFPSPKSARPISGAGSAPTEYVDAVDIQRQIDEQNARIEKRPPSPQALYFEPKKKSVQKRVRFALPPSPSDMDENRLAWEFAKLNIRDPHLGSGKAVTSGVAQRLRRRRAEA